MIFAAATVAAAVTSTVVAIAALWVKATPVGPSATEVAASSRAKSRTSGAGAGEDRATPARAAPVRKAVEARILIGI